MMGWFTPKLEPGEAVTLRLPQPARMNWMAAGSQLAGPIIGIAAAYLTGVGDFGKRGFRVMMGMFLGVGILAAALSTIPFIVNKYCWRVIVTDRRVLVRTGCLRPKQIEASRNEIDAVERDTVNQSLVFHVGGRQVAVRFPLHDEEDKVLAALNLVTEAR